MKARIAGWIVALLVFNAAAFLIMLQLPHVAGVAWALGMAALVAWWHMRPQGRMRLHALVRLRAPRAPAAWVVRATAFTLVALTGVVGLIHRFGYDLDQEDPAFWAEVNAYQATIPGAIAVMVLAAVVVPALEELVFRGRVQHSLERRHGPGRAIVVTSLLFMLAHIGGPHWSVLLIPFGLGLATGAAVYLTQSIWPGILMHALWNGLTAFTAGGVTALDESPAVLSVASILLLVTGLLGWRTLVGDLAPLSRRAGPA